MSDEKAMAECLEDLKKHAETLDSVPMVVICQGRPRCDFTGDGPPRTDCPYCVRIRADDPREPEEIIAEMNKLQS